MWPMNLFYTILKHFAFDRLGITIEFIMELSRPIYSGQRLSRSNSRGMACEYTEYAHSRFGYNTNTSAANIQTAKFLMRGEQMEN